MVSPDIPSDEAPTRRLDVGLSAHLARTLAIGLSLYALYWVLFIVQPQIYRVSFLLIALVLSFLFFPRVRKSGAPVTALDWMLIAATVVALGWPLVDFSAFIYRAAAPKTIDLVLGAVTIALVLEATRRAVGWILPITAIVFLLYAWAGPTFDDIGLPLLAHRGYNPDRLVGTLYMTLEGIFGVPLDVAATYIILFTIYGAVLELSGAGKFFIDWAMAAMGRSRSGAAPGRTVTIAGFLLGTVSGSGVATTVMLGSVAWPLLRRAGFRPETGGAILSAAGIGALLSPPTLGAAAFLIAEFLRISYLQVLVMATIPTILYYLSVFLMIEADSRRAGITARAIDTPGVWHLTRRYWYQFTSLAAIAVLMVLGLSAFRAVFWATVLAVALSYVRRETALTPRRLLDALSLGSTGVLGVVATTATAGIIVGVVTLTGLGLKIAGIIVALAAGKLFLTVLYSALAVWMLGLAVPVTASYIIAAVMVAPALVQSGVPVPAAHMFIFYYAVLSEVSPPTALSPFAAAALTGGNPFKTMMLTWKYTLPAFLVPFVFTLNAEGMGLLLQADVRSILWATATAALGVAALAAAFGGWIVRPASLFERVVIGSGGLLLFLADRRLDVAGVTLAAVAVAWHAVRRRPRGLADQRGFSLIDIMFVCSIMATLMALALPALTRSKGAAQAASALGTMRMVNSAQLDFAITCGYGFYAADLPTLGVAPPGSAYAFVGPDMAAGVTVMRAGYNFTVSATPIPGSPAPCNGLGAGITASSYALVADPVDPSLVPRYFGTNTDGLIYEHSASFLGAMPEGGSPPVGTPIH